MILYAYITLLICTLFNASLSAANGVCFHCEEIREHNRLHPHNYEYYEDYLEEQQKAAEGKQPAPKKQDGQD